MSNLQGLTASELLIRSFNEDQAPYMACDEVDRRYGEGATERLADYFTGSHASDDDVDRMAVHETDLLIEIAKGQHTCTGKILCRCGARTDQ